MLREQILVSGSWNTGNLVVYIKDFTDIYEIHLQLPGIKQNKPFLHFLEIVLFCAETWKSFLVVNFKSVFNQKLLYW